MSKITKSTLKSFINRNRDRLFVAKLTEFNGMTDGVESCNSNGFKPAEPTGHTDNTYGIAGVWFVGGGRDYMSDYADSVFKGYEVYNCCGSFRIAVKVV